MRQSAGKFAPWTRLVAGHHVLGHTLQAYDRIRQQWQTPELIMVLAQIVSSQRGTGALGRGNRICASQCGVGAVQVGRLHLHVADAFLAGEPVLPRK